jgi:hypothetical protein
MSPFLYARQNRPEMVNCGFVLVEVGDRVIVVGEVRHWQKTGQRKYSAGLKIIERGGGGKVLRINSDAA